MTCASMCLVAGTVQIAFSGLDKGKQSTLTQRHVRRTLHGAWGQPYLKISDASSDLQDKCEQLVAWTLT